MEYSKVLLKVDNLPNVLSSKYENIRNKVINVSIVYHRNDDITFKYENKDYMLFIGEYTVLKDNKINKVLYDR